jgi:hypothetical protein
MPIRVVLNVVYAMATEHMDAKQRRDFDDKLYGFDAANQAANKALWDQRAADGGES